MREKLNFKFTVDLSNGGSTPHYKVDVYKQSGELHQGGESGYPEFQCDTMPILYSEGDTIEFCFEGRNITSCYFYARPVEKIASRPSPFLGKDWHQEITNGSKVTIPVTNYYWTFSISGLYQISGDMLNGGPNKMPFLIDPDCHIIGKKWPTFDTQVEVPILPYTSNREGINNSVSGCIELYNQSELEITVYYHDDDDNIEMHGSDVIKPGKSLVFWDYYLKYGIARQSVKNEMVICPEYCRTLEGGGFVVFLPL